MARSKGKKESTFILEEKKTSFRPRQPRDHVATEYVERDDLESAEGMTHMLMPHIRQRVLTRPPKPTWANVKNRVGPTIRIGSKIG